MRIQFSTEGGLAYIPGLSRPVIIATSELPAEEADELEQLVETAGFFELPDTTVSSHGAADYQQYTISVATPGRSHTARLADPIEDPSVRELVNSLREKASEARRGPNA